MSLVVDAGPLVTLALPDDPQIQQVEEVLANERGPIVIPAQISAEVDYLLRERVCVEQPSSS